MSISCHVLHSVHLGLFTFCRARTLQLISICACKPPAPLNSCLPLHHQHAAHFTPCLQRINHFVGMMEICRKKALARNMATMATIFPKLYKFTPVTLSLPHALDRALAKLKGGRDTFIIKPDASSQVSSQVGSASQQAHRNHLHTCWSTQDLSLPILLPTTTKCYRSARSPDSYKLIHFFFCGPSVCSHKAM